MLQNRRVIVTGGGGSIGSELVRQLAPFNEVFVLDNNETACFDLIEELKQKGFDVSGIVGDICDKETVKQVFEKFHPEIVFHAAARKHVTPMEWTPMEAVNVNIIGTNNLLQESGGVERFVFISTDKVVNANSIMGCTKKVAEVMVRNAGGVSVRFGNVLGSRGSVIPLWQAQIDRGEPITITDERCERFFMTIQQACELVIKATEIGNDGDTIILDMGKPIKIIDLAKRIIEESKKDIPIKTIGLRPGETLNEQLMTQEESLRAIKKDTFWIIPNL